VFETLRLCSKFIVHLCFPSNRLQGYLSA